HLWPIALDICYTFLCHLEPDVLELPGPSPGDVGGHGRGACSRGAIPSGSPVGRCGPMATCSNMPSPTAPSARVARTSCWTCRFSLRVGSHSETDQESDPATVPPWSVPCRHFGWP